MFSGLKPRLDAKRLLVCAFMALLAAFFIRMIDGVSLEARFGSHFLVGFFEFVERRGLLYYYTGLELMLSAAPLIMIASNSYSFRTTLWMLFSYPAMVGMSAAGIAWLPIAYALCLAILLKHEISIIGVISRFTGYAALIYAYQFASLYIKQNLIVFWQHDIGIAQNSALSLDVLIFSGILVYLAYERRERNGKRSDSIVVHFWRRQRDCRQSISAAQSCDESSDESLSPQDSIVLLVVQVVQLALVALAVAINGRLMVFAIIYLLGFLPQRLSKLNGIAYHAPNMVACTIQSVVAFYVASASVPSLNVSILLPVVAGACVAWFTAMMAHKLKGETPIEEMQSTDVERLIASCDADDRTRRIMRAFWIEHKTVAQVAAELSYSESHVKNLKSQALKMLVAHNNTGTTAK